MSRLASDPIPLELPFGDGPLPAAPAHEDPTAPTVIELPIDEIWRRPPAPAGGQRSPDPNGDAGRHVIVIDLA